MQTIDRAVSATAVLAAAFLVHACGDEGSDPTAALYDPGRVLEVAIEVAPGDWDTLRHQVHQLDELIGPDCQAAPLPDIYDYFKAKVTIDGRTLTDVGVRKKGYLGSVSLSRPSLKLDFGEFVPGREFSGVEKLTLNNAVQDPSLLKQCLAYRVFHDAGLPAPRCSFAHVVVNGADLGVYVNVEGISRRMLGRFFDDDTGNLYEGQLSDFRPGWTGTYAKKTNVDDPSRADIDAVVAAAAAPAAELEARLGAVVDLDAFLRFAAVEALVASWDGYTSGGNNHYVYHDPARDRMMFVPWGQDMTFNADDPFMPDDRPQSISANAILTRRIFEVPALGERYVAAMKDVLAQAWDEDALLAEADRVQAMIEPFVGDKVDDVGAAADVVREFIRGRRATITAEIGGGLPGWSYDLSDSACYSLVGSVSGSFDTTWGTLAMMNPLATGLGSFDFAAPVGAMAQSAVLIGSAAGPTLDGKFGAGPSLQVLGVFPDNKLRMIVFFLDPELLVAGAEAPFDWQSAFGFALEVTEQGDSTPIGPLVHGKLHIDSIGTGDGDPVKGTFTADIVE